MWMWRFMFAGSVRVYIALHFYIIHLRLTAGQVTHMNIWKYECVAWNGNIWSGVSWWDATTRSILEWKERHGRYEHIGFGGFVYFGCCIFFSWRARACLHNNTLIMIACILSSVKRLNPRDDFSLGVRRWQMEPMPFEWNGSEMVVRSVALRPAIIIIIMIVTEWMKNDKMPVNDARPLSVAISTTK